jgi:uncharacterized RDD family membrane protein YckC
MLAIKRLNKQQKLQSFLRNILRPIFGAIDAIFIRSKKRQGIGDMLADTVVIINS